MQRGANSAKTGRFEGFVIGSEGRVNLVGARVELLSGVSNFATEIAKETTESDDEDKKDDAASGDFDNCSLGDVAGGLFYRAVGFGDLIQVFKAIHKHIITYWFACFKATDNFSGHVRAGLSLRAACSLHPAPVVAGDSRKDYQRP